MSIDFPVELPGAKARTLMWADPNEVEPQALQQVRNVAALPWVEGVRIMPDVHYGSGATVGSVIGMRDAVAPSAVGVDIGCGMAAVKTSLIASDLPDDLGALRSAIEAAVPVGFSAHSGTAPNVRRGSRLGQRFDVMAKGFEQLRVDLRDRQGKVLSQSGTLGGGNHFIELVRDYASDEIWIVLHSGSRNVGKEIAERHISKAKGLSHNAELPDKDLSVFLAGTPGMADYLHDLYWAQDYALLNREVMLDLVAGVVRASFPHVTFEAPVTCHHNYVSEETYDGAELVITRKGAIKAGAGQLGIIPGSMGTGSYIVRGLGNDDSYQSASHGAGRKMSRGAAKRTFSVAQLVEQTAGVECRKDGGVLDEIPGAYKDLAQVIAAQTQGPNPLVETVAHLQTLLCVKG